MILSLRRTGLVGIDDECVATPTGGYFENNRGRHTVKTFNSYMLTFDTSPQWGLERGDFVKQLEGYNCGPIACTKILKIFGLVTEY